MESMVSLELLYLKLQHFLRIFPRFFKCGHLVSVFGPNFPLPQFRNISREFTEEQSIAALMIMQELSVERAYEVCPLMQYMVSQACTRHAE